MNIQIQETPNPSTLKFIPGTEVVKKGTYHFDKVDNDYEHSPLAKQLFKIEGIRSVFFSKNFISVTKEENAEWNKIKPYILSELVDHFIADLPIIKEKKIASKKGCKKKNHKIEEQIIELINTRIRPAVAGDGGDIIYDRFENGIVYLKLHGACQGCPSASMTLKYGIENMLKQHIPEVKSVESV